MLSAHKPKEATKGKELMPKLDEICSDLSQSDKSAIDLQDKKECKSSNPFPKGEVNDGAAAATSIDKAKALFE